MADYQLRARIPNEVANEVKNIAEIINKKFPAAGATISTVSRYALQEYTTKFHKEQNNESVFIELPIKGLTQEELGIISKALEDISQLFNNETVKEAEKKVHDEFLTLEREKNYKVNPAQWENEGGEK